jgi:hypothetical protein
MTVTYLANKSILSFTGYRQTGYWERSMIAMLVAFIDLEIIGIARHSIK